MGTATTPTVLRGLLVPDPRYKWASYSTADSVVTQAGPLPGVPAAQDNSELVLEAVGDQAATSQLRIKTIRGGHPGTDAAQFLWKYEGDSSSHWRGWDPPVCITGFEYIDYTTTADKWRDFHARALDDGKIVVVADNDHTKVVCWVRDPTTGAWASHDVYDRGSSQTYSFFQCVVVLPNQRLLCFFWLESGTGSYQIRMYYSDDKGSTWTPGQKGCLSDEVLTTAYHPGWIRGDYLNGQIMLVVHMEEQATPEDRLFQYASNDLGATLDLVKEWTGKDHRYVDVLAHDGKLFVAYIAETTSGGTATYEPYLRVVGSAYEDFTGADYIRMQSSTDPMEWATQSGGLYNAGNISLWVDEDGVLYVMGREHAVGANANYEIAIRASYDGGATWAELGGGPADHEGTSTWRGMDDSTYPRDFTCVAHRGRTLVVHRCEATPSTTDDSMMALWLGGYTTVCLAQESGKGRNGPTTVTGWTDTWVCYDAPENTGTIWTATSTGTAVLGPAGLALSTGNPATEIRMANNLPGTVTEGVTVLAECKLVTNQCRVEVRWNDSVSVEYEVAAIVQTTKIVLWDLVAGSEIGHYDTTAGVDGYVQLLLDCQSNNAVLYFRAVGADGDREWTLVGTTSTCTDNGAISAPGHRVQFGQYDDSISYWHFCLLNSDGYTGEHLYGQDNYSDLLGRAFMPTPVYVDGGTSIQAVDGPTFRNEDWHIDTRYEYPVSNVFPDVASSPRRPWRSLDDNVAAEIVFSVGSAITYPMGALIGVYLGEANFGTAELYGKNAVNAWVKICDVDLRAKTALKWTRNDRLVQPDVSGANAVPYYLPTNILADSHIKLDQGQQEAAKVYKIETNSAGTWGQGGSGSLQTRILLDAVPTVSGTTSGVAAELWIKDCLTVVPLTAAYKSFKLKIAAQDTAEGYFTLGAFNFGQVFPLGSYLMEYGWGRAMEWATSVEQVEGRSGIRSVQNLSPTRRAVELAWVDGVETSGLMDANPNWVVGWNGGQPVVVPADVPYSLPGLVEYLGGADKLVTYCAAFAVPVNGTTAIHTTDRRLLLHGRFVSESLRVDNVLGDEGKTELLRLGTGRIEEEK